jgi:hypothetical protein
MPRKQPEPELNRRMSKAQRATWKNPKVHKARSKRMAVRVVGHGVFTSMAQAVAAIKLKMPAPNSYVPVRTRLAKEGRVKWLGVTFVNAGPRSDYEWQ